MNRGNDNSFYPKLVFEGNEKTAVGSGTPTGDIVFQPEEARWGQAYKLQTYRDSVMSLVASFTLPPGWYKEGSDFWDVAQSPQASWFGAGGVHNGKIYFYPGYHNQFETLPNWGSSTDFYVYSPRFNSWEQLTSFTEADGYTYPPGYATGAYGFMNGKFVVASSLIGSSAELHNDTFIYDPSTDSWEILVDSKPTLGVYNSIGGVIRHSDGKEYLHMLGGITGDTWSNFYQKSHHYFDGENWNALPDLPSHVYAAFSFVHNNRIYVMGGRKRDGGDENTNPSTDNENIYRYTHGVGWEIIGQWDYDWDVWPGSNDYRGAVIGDTAYLMGYRDDEEDYNVYLLKFDINTLSFVGIDDGTGFFDGGVSTVVDGALYYMGGYDEDTWDPVVSHQIYIP